MLAHYIKIYVNIILCVMVIKPWCITRIWSGVDGISFPGIYLSHLQDHYLSHLQILYNEEPTRKSDSLQPHVKRKWQLFKDMQHASPEHQSCPFCTSVMEKRNNAMALSVSFPFLLGSYAHCQFPSPQNSSESSNCTPVVNWNMWEKLHRHVFTWCWHIVFEHCF